MTARPTRREWLRLAAGLSLAPFAAQPAGATSKSPRVVCLEWGAAQTALALGIVPVAVADVQGYRDWVVAPHLPDAVLDVGSRFEPNREVLLALQPDLILFSEGFGLAGEELERFAPTLSISPFQDGRSAIDHARAETIRIAEVLALSDEGARLAAQADSILQDCTRRLSNRSDTPVCVVSIFEERTARVYGRSGLVGDVMERLGLRNAWQDDVGPWGFTQVGIDRFALLPTETEFLVLDPVPDPVRIRLATNSLWQSLPMVRNERVREVPPIWPFGTLPSASRTAELLADALIDA